MRKETEDLLVAVIQDDEFLRLSYKLQLLYIRLFLLGRLKATYKKFNYISICKTIDCNLEDIEELAKTQFVEFKENNVYINYL